jgi:hypothetical protein
VTVGLDAAASSGLGNKVAAGAAGLVLLVAVIAAGAGAGIASLLGGGDSPPSATATADIPPAMLALYQQAATTCPGLPWTLLAAIGTVESGNGTSNLPGVHSGANSAGAEDIWMWDRGLWDVRDGDSLVRASGVSAPCEARGGADGRHTLSIRCPLREDLSGLACGVSE